VFTARYGLIPYIKRITFRFYKVKPVYDGSVGDYFKLKWSEMIGHGLDDQGLVNGSCRDIAVHIHTTTPSLLFYSMGAEVSLRQIRNIDNQLLVDPTIMFH
jgi:hypothetical protein